MRILTSSWQDGYSYRRMYAEILRKLLADERDEDVPSVEVSTGLTLRLQEAMRTGTSEVSA